MDMEDQKSEPITEVKFVEARDPVKQFLKVSAEQKSQSSSEGNSSEITAEAGPEDVKLFYKAPRFFRSSFIDKTKELFTKNHNEAFEVDSRRPLKAKLVDSQNFYLIFQFQISIKNFTVSFGSS